MRPLLPAYLVGVGLGLAYGVAAQLSGRAGSEGGHNDAFIVMTFGYIFALPLTMGVLTVYFAERGAGRRSWAFRIFSPWLTTALSLAIAFIVGWEGSICLAMGLPVYLFMSTVGGIITGLVRDLRPPGGVQAALLAVCIVAPYLGGQAEGAWITPERRVIEVQTAIEIAAPVERVWANVVNVPEIREEQDGFFLTLGFPRPIDAHLADQRVGGVRTARFEGGLLFTEVVTQIAAPHLLEFTIHADPNSTPLTTLDPHVSPGGDYFDVLVGRFEIEPTASGSRIVLTSQHRLSTRFNWYAALWSRELMREIQVNILNVIRARAEAPALLSERGGTSR